MKCALIIAALAAALCGPFIFDGTGPGQHCRTTYDLSFNGLYLIKQQRCVGRLGFTREPREIGRRPLFREF